MDKQKIKVKKGFEKSINKSMELDMEHEPESELQKKLKLLDAPYVHSADYEFFEGKQMGIPYYKLGISTFWDAKAGYIDPYENCGN